MSEALAPGRVVLSMLHLFPNRAAPRRHNRSARSMMSGVWRPLELYGCPLRRIHVVCYGRSEMTTTAAAALLLALALPGFAESVGRNCCPHPVLRPTRTRLGAAESSRDCRWTSTSARPVERSSVPRPSINRSPSTATATSASALFPLRSSRGRVSVHGPPRSASRGRTAACLEPSSLAPDIAIRATAGSLKAPRPA